MAHQDLAAEFMAMRLAADEAEERRIERKMVQVSLGTGHTVTLYDVGDRYRCQGSFSMNELFEAGWSIERELKVQHVEFLRYDMAYSGCSQSDRGGQITEATKVKQEPMEATLLVLVRKAPRNGD